MIPELVKELINWYRWREKIRGVLIEYHQMVSILMDEEDEEIVYNGLLINYRDLTSMYYILDFVYNRKGKMAIIPKRFRFSSGLSHPNGYKRLYIKKPNCWLPDYEFFGMNY